jgi:hypothetical protein
MEQVKKYRVNTAEEGGGWTIHTCGRDLKPGDEFCPFLLRMDPAWIPEMLADKRITYIGLAY